jgi:hypothetical protein
VTSLNQRMDELCFLLARPKVEYQESRTLTNQRCDKGLAKIKSCPALDCVNPPLREKEKERFLHGVTIVSCNRLEV